MARKSIVARLVALRQGDPRGARIPVAALGVWHLIGALVAQFGEGAAFRFGEHCRNLAEVANWFRIAETELQTQIENLIGCGALLALPDGWALPDWTGIDSQKARTARENGRKGGRPRKYDVAGQREILLAFEGGAGTAAAETQTQETQRETQPLAGTRARATTYLPVNNEESVSKSVSPETQETQPQTDPPSLDTPGFAAKAAALAHEVAAMAGSPALAGPGFRTVAGWLRDGASADLVLRVVAVVLARPNRRDVTGLGYFDGAVRDALATAAMAGQDANALVHAHAREVSPAEQAARDAFHAASDQWQGRGCIGQPPRLEDFLNGAAA